MSAPQPGTLYGVGVGPGDPELLTLKAVRILAAAPVIAYFAKRGRPATPAGSPVIISIRTQTCCGSNIL